MLQSLALSYLKWVNQFYLHSKSAPFVAERENIKFQNPLENPPWAMRICPIQNTQEEPGFLSWQRWVKLEGRRRKRRACIERIPRLQSPAKSSLQFHCSQKLFITLFHIHFALRVYTAVSWSSKSITNSMLFHLSAFFLQPSQDEFPLLTQISEVGMPHRSLPDQTTQDSHYSVTPDTLVCLIFNTEQIFLLLTSLLNSILF